MSVQTPFHLTNSYVHIGSASLSRRIMDPWHREIYKAKFENEYTDEKFMNGAKQAVMLSSLLIREKKFHELAPIMTETAVDYIREKANRISDDLLLEKLSFREENIVKAYILSSAFSSSKFFAMPRDALWTFYCTVVMVIDKKNLDQQRSMRQLLKSPNSLICNMTLARIVMPLGRWMITSINYADAEHVNNQELSLT
uniref:Uncharacterized protein n=1 Tax=Ditylenchus dipsaci TaxID=166011 RepID=A0A915EAH0_9BILA